MDDENFYATEVGQFIVGAHRYLSAARVLRYSEEAEQIAERLKTPILHLVAHGMELLFKYPIIRAGASQAQVTKEYGHDLERLWFDNRNGNLRRYAELSAVRAWEEAEASGEWPNDDFSLDPLEVLQNAVVDLGHLHGRGSSFALRYTILGPTLAPRSGLLIDTFGDIAERTVMNHPILMNRSLSQLTPLFPGTRSQGDGKIQRIGIYCST